MELSTLLAMTLGCLVTISQTAIALEQGDADAMYNAFNKAFLTTNGSDVFYKAALNSSEPDGTWAGSLDILGAEDFYERTGDPDGKTLVNNLLTTWLKNTPPPWGWDGWNDDIGWFTLALVRGYQMTGNQDFLDQARYGFDFAFGRGWDTQYNGGGIWEQQPADQKTGSPNKEPLSNDSLGKVACMIYQSTNNETYLDKCQQIYTWVRKTLYDSSIGRVNAGIDQDGTLHTDTDAYSQGTFVDFAHLLYLITGDNDYYKDAEQALDFGRTNVTENGIFSNGAAYLNTWADEVARGAGHFVRDNNLWGKYYTWMVQNADSILNNRRADIGLTANAWDKPTPEDNTSIVNHFVSAMAWLQFTPATQPDERVGIHVIVNNATGMAVDSSGVYGNGKNITQSGQNNSQAQRWQLTQNSDGSFNIINLSTWAALDCPGGSNADKLMMIQWQSHRGSNQRWSVDQQSDGTYKITNQASNLVLDGASGNGTGLVQSGWNGTPQQRWIIK